MQGGTLTMRLWDRCRTERVPLNVPVWVYGRTKDEEPFQEQSMVRTVPPNQALHATAAGAILSSRG